MTVLDPCQPLEEIAPFVVRFHAGKLPIQKRGIPLVGVVLVPRGVGANRRREGSRPAVGVPGRRSSQADCSAVRRPFTPILATNTMQLMRRPLSAHTRTSFEYSLLIRSTPGRIIAAFFDPRQLTIGGRRRDRLPLASPMGVFAVEWIPTGEIDEVLGRVGGVFHGTVIEYRPRASSSWRMRGGFRRTVRRSARWRWK